MIFWAIALVVEIYSARVVRSPLPIARVYLEDAWKGTPEKINAADFFVFERCPLAVIEARVPERETGSFRMVFQVLLTYFEWVDTVATGVPPLVIRPDWNKIWFSADVVGIVTYFFGPTTTSRVRDTRMATATLLATLLAVSVRWGFFRWGFFRRALLLRTIYNTDN